MLDLTKINIRTFEVKISDSLTLTLNPPKIKVLKKIMSVASTNNIEDLVTGITLIFNSNKNKKKIDESWVEDNITFDEMLTLTKAYFEWVAEIQNNPN